MSLQELEQQTTEETASHDDSWLRKTLPPHWFTPKVVENRMAGVAAGAKQPLHGQSVNMRRKVKNLNDRFVSLHRDTMNGSMWFKCLHEDTIWPIKAEDLLSALARVTGGEWVTVTIGLEQLTVNRSHLRSALRFFKVLS